MQWKLRTELRTCVCVCRSEEGKCVCVCRSEEGCVFVCLCMRRGKVDGASESEEGMRVCVQE